MSILNTLRAKSTQKTLISFELFPPKTPEGLSKLHHTIDELIVVNPDYFSVTYGAGGSTRALTSDLVIQIRKRLGMTIVPHLTCVNSNRLECRQLLDRYLENDIHNVLALRGDSPQNSQANTFTGDFRYANELVSYIKETFPDFEIGVAGFPEGHPETPNRLKEMAYLKQKIDSGADYICTQLFFDSADFFDFQARCRLEGIRVPIFAGILPLTSKASMIRMAELSGGSRFPATLLKRVYDASSDEEVERVGIDWATQQIQALLDQQVAGIHIYTLNQSKAALAIVRNLNLG